MIGHFGKKDGLHRRLQPHVAIVHMSIELRKMEPDGSIDYKIVSEKALNRYGIRPHSQLMFSAPSEAECVKIIKDKLEKINE